MKGFLFKERCFIWVEFFSKHVGTYLPIQNTLNSANETKSKFLTRALEDEKDTNEKPFIS